MNVVSVLFSHLRRCPVACCLKLATLVLFGFTLLLAIEQTTVMSSELAKPIIMILIGVPTFTAILAVIASSRCKMDFNEPKLNTSHAGPDTS